MIPSVLANEIKRTVADYLDTTFSFQDEQLGESLKDFITDPKDGMFKGPYLAVRLPFRKANEGEENLTIFPPFTPYVHQLRSFERLSSQTKNPWPTLVTTGTGSGKTECFTYPILDHCYHNRVSGVKAIILYPMNALAADQAKRLAEMIHGDERLQHIRVGMYVGGTGSNKKMGPDYVIDDRETLRDNPPDILLTNYKMLDYLLIRPEDRSLWKHNNTDILKYLVLDELHTYDGAQGSDVANLIRRLKARLNIEPGQVAMVGTSATIASEDKDSVQTLTDFASTIFGERFTADSVILEDRISLGDFLDSNTSYYELPKDDETLVHEVGMSQLEYIESQIQVWFNEYLEPLQLGQQLKRHYFLRVLLEGFRNKIVPVDDLIQRLEKRDPEFAIKSTERKEELIHSFISLISHAKLLDGKRMIPFLQVQVQLWIREVRRLLRKVSETPEFFWKDGSKREHGSIGLPMYYCRECGHSGWLTYPVDGSGPLQRDLPSIYNRFFDEHRHMRYMYVNDGETVFTGDQMQFAEAVYIDPKDLSTYLEQNEKGVYVPVIIREAKLTATKFPRDRHSCPKCDADGAIVIAGAQAASLASVAISHLYTSPFNEDKKLLVFTDSVQDASHRASFFENRTYRFNLRTAIQAALQATSETLTLATFPAYFYDFWIERFREVEGVTNPVQRFVATFIPPDLWDNPEYKKFIANKTELLSNELKAILDKRLSWEFTMEYGLSVKTGRTLDKVKSSTIFLDPSKVRDLAPKVVMLLSGDYGEIGEFGEEKIKQFLLGLFIRLKQRGGIHHPFLYAYRDNKGNKYLLSKDQQPHISPLPGSIPYFLTDDKNNGNFDSFITGGNTQSWAVDWMRRSLSPRLSIDQMNDIYRHVVRLSYEVGILDKAGRGNHHNYGLKPQVLYMTADVSGVQCDICNYRLTVPTHEASEWMGATCRRYRCHGHYVIEKSDRQAYYRELYAKGHVERIFTEEHTGLLERKKREEVERLFKSSDETKVADAPNLLTCTPTLEMGIDVGDLSATMLNSVPPATANYVQRVGRAGRKTGNALIVTMVKASKHDLYFYEEPLAMMAGSVAPPGSYLDAPEMLKRHFLAFCMDTWARDDYAATNLPNKVQLMLAQYKKGEFPLTFLKFYELQKIELMQKFISMYEGTLSQSNQGMLSTYVERDELKASIIHVIEKTENEIQKLKRISAKIGSDLRKLEENKLTIDDYDAKVKEFENERKLIFRIMNEIREQYPLELFTNEGILPNYAFPETGVKLKAIIKKRRRQQDEDPYEVLEWVRPAKASLREFAPYNTFYGSRRKITIDQLDTGGENHSKIETWKFCNQCSHMEFVTESHYKTACPVCGSASWADIGQNREMLRQDFMQANTDDVISSTVDEADEREANRYHIKHFFDIKPENWGKAYVIEDIPFGYEYLKEVTLREINFGFQQQLGRKMDIAGEEVARDGFKVCKDCGIVQKPKFIEGNEPKHRYNCKYNRANQNEQNAWSDLVLYREVTSEAIRILLPISTIQNGDKLYTFKACLELGLRKWYRGNPGHLVVKEHVEPIQGEQYGKRHFLVIYDEVPGGTGYLKNLVETNTFLEVLEKAYEALITCDCEQQDGCYKCLYAYQNQYEIDVISKKLGIQLLKQILNLRDKVTLITTLSDVAIESVVESELEASFISKLKDYIESLGEKATWKQMIFEGKVCYELTLENGNQWRIVPQVLLKQSHGVGVASKPDFVCYPVHPNERIKPIAIFTDGFKYHVKPNDPRGGVGEDVRKRLAIRDSGDYMTWTITWEDVETFKTGELKKRTDSQVLTEEMYKVLQALKKNLHIPLEDYLWGQNKVTQLIQYFIHPHKEFWEQYALLFILASFEKRTISFDQAKEKIAYVGSTLDIPNLTIASHTAKGDYGYTARNQISSSENLLSFIIFPLSIMVELQKLSRDSKYPFSVRGIEGIVRLEDGVEMRNGEDFKRLWNEFWRLLNLIQFLPNVTVVTKELIEEYGSEFVLEKVSEDSSISEEWEAVIEIVDDACIPPLRKLIPESISLPVVGYEVQGESGAVIGELELAWEDKKAGILLEEDETVVEWLNRKKWCVFLVEELEENISSLKDALL
ncbi:DEAD/DEAH box helicase [Priestia megaterium]|uniref:DEAD/DEAH box helicase n=1 Tax=Priestia megaterium TaxID=1404 RepID=UPI00336B0CC6